MAEPTPTSLPALSLPRQKEVERDTSETLREAVQRTQERWTALGLAYMRGEASRQEAREATLAYDVAQARLSGNPDLIRAAESAR